MYENPKRFFTRFLILTIMAIFVVVITVAVSSAGTVGIIIGAVLAAITAFFLIGMLVIAIIHFVKYMFDRSKHNNMVMHLVNVVFALFVNVGFLLFYFVIVVGALIILAPFTT